MKSRWVTHKDQKIFYYDYRDFGFDADGVKAEIEEVEDLVSQQPEHSMLILVDIRDTVISREVSAMVKENSQHTKPYAHRVAIVGVKGVVRVIADSIGRLTRGTPQAFFDDLKEAMDWLVESA
jgi:hypothetical protein